MLRGARTCTARIEQIDRVYLIKLVVLVALASGGPCSTPTRTLGLRAAAGSPEGATSSMVGSPQLSCPPVPTSSMAWIWPCVATGGTPRRRREPGRRGVPVPDLAC
jgi:hypothetical protein